MPGAETVVVLEVLLDDLLELESHQQEHAALEHELDRAPVSSSDSRCSGVNQRAAPWPVTMPATTAATSPEPPSCSVGR